MNKNRKRIGRMKLLSLLACMFVLPADAQNVSIGGLKYYLYPESHEAVIDNGNTWAGELDLPSEVNYNGEAYTVNGMGHLAFSDCTELTKVRIPKTIDHVVHHVLSDDPHVTGIVSDEYMNPFMRCSALESIEVDEGNPSMKSVDGVLFSKDGTGLYCYPAGLKVERYVVPQGVTWVGGDAFSYNEHIVSVELPSTVDRLCVGAFSYCKRLEEVSLPEDLIRLEAFMFRDCSSLKSIEIPTKVAKLGEQVFYGCTSLRIIDLPESVKNIGSFTFYGCKLDALVIRGLLDSQSVGKYLFSNLKESSTVYTLTMQVNSFKQLFAGTVLSLEHYLGPQETVNIDIPVSSNVGVALALFDLQGRRIQGEPQRKGIYVKDGKKYVKK